MAIRSSEFDIPAAIGCGENIFNELSSHEFVILNCEDKLIKPIKLKPWESKNHKLNQLNWSLGRKTIAKNKPPNFEQTNYLPRPQMDEHITGL